jgi:hypothetical protein
MDIFLKFFVEMATLSQTTHSSTHKSISIFYIFFLCLPEECLWPHLARERERERERERKREREREERERKKEGEREKEGEGEGGRERERERESERERERREERDLIWRLYLRE